MAGAPISDASIGNLKRFDMATTPEGRVKDKVKATLMRYRAYFHMNTTFGFGASGAPDFDVCYRGCFVGIETKAGSNKLAPLQYRRLALIHGAGGVALVINETNVDLVATVLDMIAADGACPDMSNYERFAP